MARGLPRILILWQWNDRWSERGHRVYPGQLIARRALAASYAAQDRPPRRSVHTPGGSVRRIGAVIAFAPARVIAVQ